MKLLDRVFEEQYAVQEAEGIEVRSEEPVGAVKNPYDPDVEWAAKGRGKSRKEFEGYKVQVAETVSPARRGMEKGEPTNNFLTAVMIQRATESDEAGREQVLEEQAEMGLEKPVVEYVDGPMFRPKKSSRRKRKGAN